MSPPVSLIWQRISLKWHGSWINTAAKQSQIKYMHHYTVYQVIFMIILFSQTLSTRKIFNTQKIYPVKFSLRNF